MRQLLSAICLLVLVPTSILFPFAGVMAVTSILRLGTVISSPLSIAGTYPPHFSAAEILYLELLGLGWVSGYFLILLAFLLLSLPFRFPKGASFALWIVPVVYLMAMLTSEPWGNPVWGISWEPAFSGWAVNSIKILLPASLLGLWLARPRRVALPPPFPA